MLTRSQQRKASKEAQIPLDKPADRLISEYRSSENSPKWNCIYRQWTSSRIEEFKIGKVRLHAPKRDSHTEGTSRLFNKYHTGDGRNENNQQIKYT